MRRDLLAAVLLVVSAACVVAGVATWSIGFALITAGVLGALLTFALVVDVAQARR